MGLAKVIVASLSLLPALVESSTRAVVDGAREARHVRLSLQPLNTVQRFSRLRERTPFLLWALNEAVGYPVSGKLAPSSDAILRSSAVDAGRLCGTRRVRVGSGGC